MKNLFIVFACMLMLTRCASAPDEADELLSLHKIFVRYSDSTYTSVIDSATIYTYDTTALLHATGYYRIASPDGSFFDVGHLVCGKKTGVWKSYNFWDAIPKQTLNTIATYQDGKLNGAYFTFTRDSALIESFFYVDNKQVGKQKEYDDESRRPVLIYETNEDEQFINDYLAISDKGDTLYHTNFGKDATGYVKRYDRWGVILSEGMMIRGKQEALTYYEYDYYHERYISARHYIVTDTSADLQWTKDYPEK